MPDLRSQLQELRTKLATQAGKDQSGGSPADQKAGEKLPRLDVVIGLDFGTRYTKIAYRIVGVDTTHIIGLDAGQTDRGLYKTVLFINTSKMAVYRAHPTDAPALELGYLKLLLKGAEQPTVLVPAELRKILSPDAIKALSAFFLSALLRRALLAIAKREANRISGKDVFISLNVSLPAEHCDDSATDRFREVSKVALHWAYAAISTAESADLNDLIERYASDTCRPLEKWEVSVFPEIIAALYQFITRRDVPEGIHGFLDIGAGTMDGCVFRIIRNQNRPTEVNILGAKVAPLGTIAVATKAFAYLYLEIERTLEPKLVTADKDAIEVQIPLARASQELADFTGQLLVSARDRMHAQLLIHDPAAVFDSASRQRELARSFTFIVSGGGAKSKWYARVVTAVFNQRGLGRAGIMSYQCALISPPAHFDADGSAFERFVIAYGLTADAANLESLKVRLPPELSPTPPPARRPSAAVNYLDSKEALT